MSKYLKQVLDSKGQGTPSKRQSMVSRNILKVLSSWLSKGLLHSTEIKASCISFTHASIAPNLMNIKVYVSFIGSDEERKAQIKLLNDSSHIARTYISKNVKLRKAPEVFFTSDDSAKAFEKVNALLKEDPKSS